MPGNSLLGRVLADWSTYAYKSMTKKKMIFYCNTAWLMYNLDSGEHWLLNGLYHTAIKVVLSKIREMG